MSFPILPSITPTISLSLAQTIPLLLDTIALEEFALAHLINAEAEKLQFVMGTLTPTTVSLSPPFVTISDLRTTNTDVRKTLQDVIKKEMLLQFKFEDVLDLLATIQPTTGSTPIVLASLKFFARVSSGTVSGADLIIPASTFVDDNGNAITALPSVYQYFNLYINGMIQENGIVFVSPSNILISGGSALDSNDPITLEFVVSV